MHESPRTELRVRRLTPDEWTSLREIRLRALADAPDAFGSTLEREEQLGEREWREWIEAPDRIVVVADAAGRVAGMASGGPVQQDPTVAGLFAMWVEPELRGTGAAASLVAAVEDWARESGYAMIGLGVTTTNERARTFYARMGYRDRGWRMPLRPGSPLEIEIMDKRLDAELES